MHHQRNVDRQPLGGLSRRNRLRLTFEPVSPTFRIVRAPLVSTRRVENRLPQILHSTTTIVACPYQTSWHRAGVLAALEDRNTRRKRCFVSINTLNETPTASGHVMNKLRLVQSQTIKVYDIDIGAQAREQPTAIRQTEKVRGFAGLPLDQMLKRQLWPAASVAAPVRQHETRQA